MLLVSSAFTLPRLSVSPARPGQRAALARLGVVALTLLVGATLASNSFAQGGCFDGQVVTPISLASSTAVGDVDGDGDPDVVSVVTTGPSVSVSRRQANGTYSSPVAYTVGSSPIAVALGDLNGDSFRDIVVANFGANTISVLFNSGTGTFAAPVNYVVGSGPVAVAVADVSGDGLADVVVANQNSNNLSVLVNAGGGTLGTPSTSPTGATPVSIAMADVNGDGRIDAAVANRSGNSVAVLINVNGSFPAATLYTVGATPFSVDVGDVDGDGLLDLVAPSAATSSLSVLRGVGAGLFAAQVVTPCGNGPRQVTLGDLDADGRADAVVGRYGQGLVEVLRSLGGGAFAAPVVYTASVPAYDVDLFDEDADGRLDLYVTDGGVRVAHGTGTGAFFVPQTATTGSGPRSAVLADLDGDGTLDAVTANGVGDSVSYLRGLGNGGFAPHVSTSVVDDPYAIASGDVDGDGDVDVVTANNGSGNISVLKNNGAGGFAAAVPYSTGASTPRSIALGDLDGDGDLDAVTGNQSSLGTAFLSVLRNSGNGAFSAPTTYAISTTSYLSVAIGDVDGDGDRDVVVAGTINLFRVFLNTGTGSLVFSSQLTGSETWQVSLGDLDADGDLDAVLANGTPANVTPVWNSGNGTFVMGSAIPTGGVTLWSVVADVDQDGLQDIAASAGGALAIVYGLGGGAFGPATRRGFGIAGADSLALGDLDGDGNVDALGVSEGVDAVSTLKGCSSTGLAFCSGDGGGTACPCGNSSAASSNEGCRNSLGVDGRLRASGVARLANDTLELKAGHVPNGPSLFFQGTTQLNGGSGVAFGDGLRCVGGAVVRLGVVVGIGNAATYPSPNPPATNQIPISIQGFVTPGTRHYQTWYRDSAAFCTTSTFNLTNGLSVTWIP